MKTFSIIIPHHGPEEQLDRLLGSIPEREDLEVIVVRDDSRKGAGWARNQGVKQAVGEYVIFADSDDYFLPGIDSIMDNIRDREGGKVDVFYFDAKSVEEDTGKASWRSYHLNWIMQNDPSERDFLLRYTFTEPWCKAIRRELIVTEQIRFDETRILNDVFFSAQVGHLAHSIEAMAIRAYCIVNRNASTAKVMDRERRVEYSRVFAKTNRYLMRHGIGYYHPRMLRQVAVSLLHLDWGTAARCIEAIRDEGFTRMQLVLRAMAYPYHVMIWAKNKITKRA